MLECVDLMLARALAQTHLQPPSTPNRAPAVSPSLPERSPPKRLDGVDTRDGVDALLLPRRALQDRVLAQRRVLVMAPPGAGKTSLIQLLRKRLGDEKRRVLSLSTLTARADILRANPDRPYTPPQKSLQFC